LPIKKKINNFLENIQRLIHRKDKVYRKIIANKEKNKQFLRKYPETYPQEG